MLIKRIMLFDTSGAFFFSFFFLLPFFGFSCVLCVHACVCVCVLIISGRFLGRIIHV